MVWVLAAIAGVQVVETFTCGLSLFTLFSVLPRIMFAMRVTGSVFKTTTLAILECVAFGTWTVWRGLITHNFSWVRFLVFAVCVIICIVIYIVDTESYVYVVGDDENHQ